MVPIPFALLLSLIVAAGLEIAGSRRLKNVKPAKLKFEQLGEIVEVLPEHSEQDESTVNKEVEAHKEVVKVAKGVGPADNELKADILKTAMKSATEEGTMSKRALQDLHKNIATIQNALHNSHNLSPQAEVHKLLTSPAILERKDQGEVAQFRHMPQQDKADQGEVAQFRHMPQQDKTAALQESIAKIQKALQNGNKLSPEARIAGEDRLARIQNALQQVPKLQIPPVNLERTGQEEVSQIQQERQQDEIARNVGAGVTEDEAVVLSRKATKEAQLAGATASQPQPAKDKGPGQLAEAAEQAAATDAKAAEQAAATDAKAAEADQVPPAQAVEQPPAPDSKQPLRNEQDEVARDVGAGVGAEKAAIISSQLVEGALAEDVGAEARAEEAAIVSGQLIERVLAEDVGAEARTQEAAIISRQLVERVLAEDFGAGVRAEEVAGAVAWDVGAGVGAEKAAIISRQLIERALAEDFGAGVRAEEVAGAVAWDVGAGVRAEKAAIISRQLVERVLDEDVGAGVRAEEAAIISRQLVERVLAKTFGNLTNAEQPASAMAEESSQPGPAKEKAPGQTEAAEQNPAPDGKAAEADRVATAAQEPPAPEVKAAAKTPFHEWPYSD